MKRLVFIALVLCIAFTFLWCCYAATQQKVVVDFSSTKVLDDFNNDRAREALLRHLSASADWHVSAHLEITPDHKTKRFIWAEYPARHARTMEEVLQFSHQDVRVTLRFDSSFPITNLENGTYVLAKAGANAVEMSFSNAFDDSHTLNSDLIIEGGSLVLEIVENSADRDRSLTKKAMQQVVDELSDVKDNVERIERDGYLRKWLPASSVKESVVEAPLEIREDLNRGRYWVSGYVNPHEKGYITIRTFHVQSGKELNADVNSWRTLQYVGWSLRPNEWFYFNCDLTAPSYLTEEESKLDSSDRRRYDALAAKQNIRVEVWFHGTKDRKLLETTQVLQPWMR
jgi:hypothetical protein